MSEENTYQSTKSWCFFKVFKDGSEHIDLTRCLAKVQINNNINNSYGIIHLYFWADNQLWIEDDIYPDMKLRLQIWYADEKGTPEPVPITLDLLILENNIDLAPKVQDNIGTNKRDSQRRMSVCTCITIQAYKIMSAVVNRLWESDGKSENNISPYDAVLQLIDDVGIVDKQIEEAGKNTNKLDQLIIPPMSFSAALNHINDLYGVYMNQMLKYVQYNGTFTMWDIVEYYNSHIVGDIFLHKLPSYSVNKAPEEATRLAKLYSNHYVCYDNVQTISIVNNSILKNGYKQTYLYHPASDIIHHVNKNIGNEYILHGVISGNPDMKMHSDMQQRYVVNYDVPGMMKTWRGFEPASNPITSKMSEQLLRMHAIRFQIQRQIKIHDIIKIGQVLYLKPYSEHEKFGHSSYEGTYLVTESEVILSRFRNGYLDDNVDCHATITGFRTNQSYT